MKVYIASPLFTPEEKKVINEVAKVLHQAGHETYLPMEHGVVDAWSYSNIEWAKKIFALDKDAIDDCDALVSIYYGMNSDSGTSWENGYARGKDKIVVVFHNYDIEKEIGSVMICNGADANTNTIESIPYALKCLQYDKLPYQS